MEKTATPLYVMNLCENGQSIYVDQSDPTRGFIFDDEGNLRDFSTEAMIKTENHIDDSNDGAVEISENIPGDLGDGTHLGIISGLDEGHNFEDSLMRELDTGIMNMESEEDDNCIMQHMDIRQPLSTLKNLLEQRLNVDLSNYKFYLQETQMLESHKNLVDQCVQGEGLVQINVQIQSDLKRINIVDVLKPAEDYIDLEEEKTVKKKKFNETPIPELKKAPEKEKKVVTQWQIDLNFKNEQDRLKIPSDPKKWNVVHVRHWVQWAVRQFNLPNVKLSDWSMTGEDLFKMDINDFQKKVPRDPGDIFWTHFELLRQMKVVACKKEERIQRKIPKHLKNQNRTSKLFFGCPSSLRYVDRDRDANRAGYNGQVQLWQFLLELLTCPNYKPIIHWLGSEGEFKLCAPEDVARLWGERKNKPTMNYEKLSRALRYYYDGDMISKVHGKRFVYKFVCDLKQLLGYNAVELANLITYGNPLPDGS